MEVTRANGVLRHDIDNYDVIVASRETHLRQLARTWHTMRKIGAMEGLES
jgi:hypothetical protein